MNLTKKTFRFTQLILVLFVLAFSAHAAGEVDTSFLANLHGFPSGTVKKILVLPDGKALVGGNFRIAGNFTRSGLFRLNSDGTIDTSFQLLDFYNVSGIGGTINAMALQADGKILVGGDFQGANSVARQGLMRLNADGSIDSAFDAQVSSGGNILDILVLADGRILIAGNFTIADGSGNRVGIAKLNSDGGLDPLIYQNIIAINKLVLLSDGKLVAGSGTNVRRFNLDGTFDPSFNNISTSSSVLDMELLDSGKMLIAGNFITVNGQSRRGLFRINPDGSVDTTYNPGGSDPNPGVIGMTRTPGGKFLIFGSFSGYNGVPRNRAALIDENGMLDTSFTMASNSFSIFEMAVLPDGKVLVGGPAPGNPNMQNALIRVNADGTADSTFNVLISNTSGPAYTVLVQPDGKILVGGQFPFANGVSRGNLARFNPDGSLDTTFTPPTLNLSGGVYDLALQPDGKILVPLWLGGSGFAYRLNPDGTPDILISNATSARDVESLPDGKFLIATGDRVRRYNTNGGQDFSFTSITTAFSDQIYRLAVQPDGKIIVAGTFTMIGGQTRGRIARLNADGTLDTTFNPPGGANGNIHTVLVQSDGKLLVGGAFTGFNFDNNKQYLVRLNPDGSLDTGFAPVLNAPVLGLKLQADGKLLIAGAMSTVNGVLRPGIARINPDGSLDTGFNVGSGANSTVWGVDLQNDKIIYAGQFTATDGFTTLGIGRLLNDSVPQQKLFDYDGDGLSDVSVFRPSENRWYLFLSSTSSVSEKVFAISGDIPAPADFDGDGKTDLAIFRPSTGDWWYLSSVNNAQIQTHWGQPADIPRPSDFDGDGRADFVIFRPGENNWYRFGSTGQVSVVNFGSSGDKPVIGDFDGDGKSDVAVYRPTTGTWWYQSSINNAQIATQFGIETDIPVAADYDGDGKTDIGVYRPSTGVWYISNSGSGTFTIVKFGIGEDKPVAADYDGDGKADIGVYRPSTGIWYQLKTTEGFGAIQFGVSTDIPTPNAFIQ
ncbi:MAG: FG-GAP-like repeat-containing protein [Pyrinomonadaceae bacterium]